MTVEEQVILVNEAGDEIGSMPKLEAHQKGALHKAISVLIFNDKNEMLLQQRSQTKYHWPGIWSNACCTHPRKEESYIDAAKRRLEEELGFTTELREAFSFIYKAKDPQSGLIEHELDYVFLGMFNGNIPFDIAEVQNIKWISIADLEKDISQHQEKYSFWFKIILEEMASRKMLPL